MVKITSCKIPTALYPPFPAKFSIPPSGRDLPLTLYRYLENPVIWFNSLTQHTRLRISISHLSILGIVVHDWCYDYLSLSKYNCFIILYYILSNILYSVMLILLHLLYYTRLDQVSIFIIVNIILFFLSVIFISTVKTFLELCCICPSVSYLYFILVCLVGKPLRGNVRVKIKHHSFFPQ